MKSFMCLLVFLVSIALNVQPARADYSERAESNGGTMRIASLPMDGTGQIHAVLDIELKDQWITYWREPGSSGIPPQIALSDSARGTVSNIQYPVPKKIMLGDLLDIGYDGSVKIPFSISLKDPQQQAPFAVSVLIGVCKDICIPFNHEFMVDPKAGANTLEIAGLVNEAAKKLPSPPSDDFKVEQVQIASDRRSVDLELTVPDGTKDLSQLIIAGPPGHAYTLVNQVKIEGTKALLNVDAISLPKDYQEAGKLWHLLVSIGGRTMETQHKFPKP